MLCGHSRLIHRKCRSSTIFLSQNRDYDYCLSQRLPPLRPLCTVLSLRTKSCVHLCLRVFITAGARSGCAGRELNGSTLSQSFSKRSVFVEFPKPTVTNIFENFVQLPWIRYSYPAFTKSRRNRGPLLVEEVTNGHQAKTYFFP